MGFTLLEQSMEFERSRKRKTGSLNLTPMIDVMFILIIFFMLTTTFMRIESLELNLPSVSAKAAADKGEVMHLFIQANGDMLLGQRKVDQEELIESMKRLFEKDTNTKVMLLSAEGVTMQQLVGIMDRVYMAGGRSLFVRKWQSAPPAATQPTAGASTMIASPDATPAANLAPAAGTAAKAPAAPARAPAKPVLLH